MTHRELRTLCRAPGVAPVPCMTLIGPLRELELISQVRDPAADDHLIEVYRCPDCGRVISADADEPRIRNDYESPAAFAAALRQHLAGILRVGSHRPRRE